MGFRWTDSWKADPKDLSEAAFTFKSLRSSKGYQGGSTIQMVQRRVFWSRIASDHLIIVSFAGLVRPDNVLTSNNHNIMTVVSIESARAASGSWSAAWVWRRTDNNLFLAVTIMSGLFLALDSAAKPLAINASRMTSLDKAFLQVFVEEKSGWPFGNMESTIT
jgi:hypothetical protein